MFIDNIMIVDCINFYNEVEILHLRLDYLYDVVDRFVIVESLDSHSKRIRKDKYVFEENIEIYKPYLDKICFLKIDNLPFPGDKGKGPTRDWRNENYQKDFCIHGIEDLSENDWILYSDLDEIPDKKHLQNIDQYKNYPGICFEHKLFYYYVNVLQTQLITGTLGVQKKNFTTFMNLRNRRRNLGDFLKIDNGGWHYSYMGGVDKVYEKMQSYAESEQNNKFCNKDNIQKSLQTNIDHLGRKGDRFHKRVINIDSPGMAPDNIHKIINLYPTLYKSV